MPRFARDEVASQRLKIIKFYTKYSEAETKEAFGVDRKTIYVWKKRLNLSQGKLTSLIPTSTKPINARGMETDPKVVSFIKTLREAHPRLGKEKIYPLLVSFCREEGILPIKESTIGKVIKRNKLFYQKERRMYHNPASKYAKRTKTKRLRVRYSPKHKDLGHIQVDTIVRFQDGIKYYLYTAIDTKGKFAFCLPFKTLTSSNTLDFYQKLIQVLPYKVKSVQTDNGLEFLGAFDAYLEGMGIVHLYTYPRCPKINGVVERFNRSIQDEFVDSNLHLIHNQKIFSSKLADYLLFYNCVRVHKSLDNITPMAYLMQKGVMSNNSVTYTKY
ncbi:MAG: integrase core domain-containing protein [Candidatus Woesebacteria bacterium]|nr:integrase core domain-containing protein [Candidatus Woesebacteria bacterium]